MKKVLAIFCLGIALAGCDVTTSILSGGLSPFATVQNPASTKELAVVEASYRVAISAAVNYRRLGLCKKGQVESVQNLCARRAVVVQLQDADRKVRVALTNARSFIRNNPNVSAITVISAARNAVAEFQTVLSTNGVQ